MTVAEAILQFSKPYRNVLRGAQIAKVTPEEAQIVADLTISEVPTLKSLTKNEALCFLLSVMGQESRHDKLAFNLNLKRPLVSWETLRALLFLPRTWEDYRPTEAELLGADLGIAMFKVKYIHVAPDSPELHGKPLKTVINDYLMNPEWAIPKMARRYATLLTAVPLKYPGEDPMWISTGIYNQGATGFARGYKVRNLKPEDPGYDAAAAATWQAAARHMGHVKRHYQWFREHVSFGEV